ncbi:MAG: class I tRNA ligase family protein [Nocardioidaceae bacterium]
MSRRDAARSRIITIIEQSLRLLHPFMPFLTEELWQKLPNVSSDLHNDAYKNAAQTIMLADFPKGDAELIDEQAEAEMQAVIELISKVRNIRAEMNIKPSGQTGDSRCREFRFAKHFQIKRSANLETRPRRTSEFERNARRAEGVGKSGFNRRRGNRSAARRLD